jgi:hypothetical protein
MHHRREQARVGAPKPSQELRVVLVGLVVARRDHLPIGFSDMFVGRVRPLQESAMARWVVVACLIVTFLLATAPPALAAPVTPAPEAPRIFVDALAGSFIVSLIVLTFFVVRPKTSPTPNTAAAPTALGPRTGVDLRRLDVDGNPGEFTIEGGDGLAVWHF